MKLSQNHIQEAQLKLNLLESQITTTEAIKAKIRQQNKKIQLALDNLKASQKSPSEKILILHGITENILIPKILELDSKNKLLLDADDKHKSQKERLIRQKLKTSEQIEKYKQAITDINKTIAQIKKTVDESKIEEQKKRQKIQADLQKSLDQIRVKIATQEKQSIQLEEQNVKLQQKNAQLSKKLSEIQSSYQTKSQQKDDEIKAQKEQLLERLKQLENEASQITKLNGEYTTIQKKNFDNKLTLHIKQTKFNEYSTNFQGTGKLINQCKQQLVKAVARLNESKQKKEKYEKDAQNFDKTFLSFLGTKNNLVSQIEKTKKSKQSVRSKILQIQNQIKAKKEVNNNSA